MALSVGTDPGEQSVPKMHTNCTFGKWYYGVGQELNNLDSFNAIESIHLNLHQKYNDIFDKFEKLTKDGFFNYVRLRESDIQKNFNASIEILKEISKQLFLKEISKQLLVKLSELENNLN